MNDQDKREIYAMFYDYFNDYYFEERMQAKEFFQEIKEYIAMLDRISKRMDIIEHTIEQHAVGVQNVYSEVQRIKDMYNLPILDKDLLDKIDEFRKVNEALKTYEFVNCSTCGKHTKKYNFYFVPGQHEDGKVIKPDGYDCHECNVRKRMENY